ncbi:MAG: ABC transporter ATP-binding protein [Steroidobacteraceae bacterium]|nr:ABC transporter ATP-binding protein [Steroidobacteraceae bacterium]
MTGREPLLDADDLRVTFRPGGRELRAVDGVSLQVLPGETVALVGESGSGKSTVALALMGVHPLAGGRVRFEGRDVTAAGGAERKALRRRMQLILQDPYGSLDPRWSVARILAEPLVAHDVGTPEERAARVRELLGQVGLPLDALERRPPQLSGGQRQRIAIARALALEPRLLIADEPVSALDVSIQAQIVNLLLDVQRTRGTSLLVITHDIALVHHVAHRVVVMYLGRVVETGAVDDVILRPQHPYTAALISAVPARRAGGARQRILLPGEPPSPLEPPAGCRFHPRCPIARDRCRIESPPLAPAAGGGATACHFPGELGALPLARDERLA